MAERNSNPNSLIILHLMTHLPICYSQWLWVFAVRTWSCTIIPQFEGFSEQYKSSSHYIYLFRNMFLGNYFEGSMLHKIINCFGFCFFTLLTSFWDKPLVLKLCVVIGRALTFGTSLLIMFDVPLIYSVWKPILTINPHIFHQHRLTKFQVYSFFSFILGVYCITWRDWNICKRRCVTLSSSLDQLFSSDLQCVFSFYLHHFYPFFWSAINLLTIENVGSVASTSSHEISILDTFYRLISLPHTVGIILL